MSIRSAVHIALTLVFAHLLSAAVDCRYPRNRTERVLCSDPALVKLDEQLSDLFSKALAAATADEKEKLEIEQDVWANSGQCWNDKACITKRYEERIATVQQFMTRPSDSTPPGASTPAVRPLQQGRTPRSAAPTIQERADALRQRQVDELRLQNQSDEARRTADKTVQESDAELARVRQQRDALIGQINGLLDSKSKIPIQSGTGEVATGPKGRRSSKEIDYTINTAESANDTRNVPQ